MKLEDKAKKMLEEIKEESDANYVLITDTKKGTKLSVSANPIASVKMLVALEDGLKDAFAKSSFPIPYEAIKAAAKNENENSDKKTVFEEKKED